MATAPPEPSTNTDTINLVRQLSLGFNFLMLILAITFSIYGYSVGTAGDNYGNLLTFPTLLTPTCAVVFGTLLSLAAALAIYGLLSSILLATVCYIVLLVIIFITQAMVGAGLFTTEPDLNYIIQTTLENSMHEYFSHENIKKDWDNMQIDFRCCGPNAPYNWLPIFNDTLQIPVSCCRRKDNTDEMCYFFSDPTKVYQEGCFHKVTQMIGKSTYRNVLEFGIALQIIEFINIVLAVVLHYMYYKNHNFTKNDEINQ